MKRCSRCKLEKLLSDFRKGTCNDGLQAYCKDCQREYQRARANKDFDFAGREEYLTLAKSKKRRCTQCREIKPFEAFGPDACNVGTGRYPICKVCTQARRDARRPSDKPKIGSPEFRPRRYYGLSIAEHSVKIQEQEGRCKICKVLPPRGLVVDHNHRTNRFRGLTCPQCNTAIGMLKDSPELCRAVAEYLEKYS